MGKTMMSKNKQTMWIRLTLLGFLVASPVLGITCDRRRLGWFSSDSSETLPTLPLVEDEPEHFSSAFTQKLAALKCEITENHSELGKLTQHLENGKLGSQGSAKTLSFLK